MRIALTAPVFACAVLLSGCVVVPTAPTVLALPGSQKPFDQFQADDISCRNYANATVAGPGQAAANNAASTAAASTAIGAAAGALIGAATGSAGSGAAIGAGTGLLFGSAAGGNYAGYSSYDLQHQYDASYLQCMYARGNRVPVRSAYNPYGPVYRAPGAPADYPPANYPPPRDAIPAPANAPPPTAPR